MTRNIGWIGMMLLSAMIAGHGGSVAPACCPTPRRDVAVVNADQTVILIWDAANKTQHFIRRASFKSAGDDFGFLIPSPSQPDLDESGDDASIGGVESPLIVPSPTPPPSLTTVPSALPAASLRADASSPPATAASSSTP